MLACSPWDHINAGPKHDKTINHLVHKNEEVKYSSEQKLRLLGLERKWAIIWPNQDISQMEQVAAPALGGLMCSQVPSTVLSLVSSRSSRCASCPSSLSGTVVFRMIEASQAFHPWIIKYLSGTFAVSCKIASTFLMEATLVLLGEWNPKASTVSQVSMTHLQYLSHLDP